MEQEVIDFSHLDKYPQFPNCEGISYEESKMCFEESAYTKINDQVQALQFSIKQNIIDTLKVEFTINEKGYFSTNKISISDSLEFYIPNLSTEIKEIILGLPAITPAQKRGIPVKSVHTIPLIIKTE